MAEMQNTCIILSSAGYGKSVYKRRFYTALKFQCELALTNKERIMNMNVKKSLAVFAAILTAASAFAGCSSENTSTVTTSAETTVSAADTVEASEAEVSDDNNQELAYEYVAGYMDMSKTFSGVFDGNGHTLSNYTYKNDGNQMAVGIFGAVTGTVKNLNVENADISGDTSAMATGGVIEYLLSGKASGTNCTGGIVGGSFTGSLDNCSAKGTVTAEGNGPVGLGGIAGGVAEITFDEGTVSGIDDKGNSIFSHEYEFCGYDETNGFYEYKSTDDNEDEFTYFGLLTDTPASAFQIEFRYGSDLDELTNYTDGKYAYRMASGILKDCDEDMIRNSIELFCTENLAG